MDKDMITVTIIEIRSDSSTDEMKEGQYPGVYVYIQPTENLSKSKVKTEENIGHKCQVLRDCSVSLEAVDQAASSVAVSL